MSDGNVKVAFIAGTGKSGSTLLGKLLGQVGGFVDVGELINIDWQFERKELCACGEAVSVCDFWTKVVGNSIGSIEDLDRARWHRLKTRYLPLLLVPGARRPLQRYFKQLHHLIMGVARVTEANVIVDSSKSAFYGAVLGLFPDIDVYTLHLVRDVRGSEGSMHRLKSEGAGKWINRNTWWNSIRWMIVNLLTEFTARATGSRYMRVRYEDLVTDPTRVIAEIAIMLDEPEAKIEFLSGNRAQLSKTHTIAGSDVRFKQGLIELQLDERWKQSLPESNRAVVDGLTGWFRRRYGY